MHEALFHELDLGSFLVVLRDGGAAMASLRQPRLEWAISVIYRPETERLSHYFSTRSPEQYARHPRRSQALLLCLPVMSSTALW